MSAPGTEIEGLSEAVARPTVKPQINTANIDKLIEVLRQIKPSRFNMNVWASAPKSAWSLDPARLATDCGTCGCIGGWTNAIFGGLGRNRAQASLGLNRDRSEALFYPYGLEGSDGAWRITRAQAIRVLEHLRDHGEVDWSKRGRR